MKKIFVVRARSFEGRIPLNHEFEIAGESKEEAINAVKTRWPQLYNIEVEEK